MSEAKRIRELEDQVYVPGMTKCAKCDFVLVSNFIGEHGTMADNRPQKCPNDGHPMWRVTYKDECHRIGLRLEAMFREKEELKKARPATVLRMAWDHIHGASLTRFDAQGGILTHEEGLTIK